MWYLDEFDKKTERLINNYLLEAMSAEIVKKILEVTDDDHDLPVGVRQNEVPLSKVRRFTTYIREPFEVNENCEYEVGFSAD